MSQAPFFHQCFLILSFSDHPLHRFSFAHLKNLCHKVNMTTTPNCPVIKFQKVSSWRFFIFPFSYFRRLVRGRSIKEANYLEETPSVIYGENLNWSPWARIHKYKIQNTNTQVFVMALMMMKQGHGAESAGLEAQFSCWVELVLILLSVLKIKPTPPTILQCINYTSQ